MTTKGTSVEFLPLTRRRPTYQCSECGVVTEWTTMKGWSVWHATEQKPAVTYSIGDVVCNRAECRLGLRMNEKYWTARAV